MKGYMYILECSDGSYYTGSTTNLELRLALHQAGEGANHTKKRLPVNLVYYEEYQRIDEAFYREKQVQGWSRKKKEALINGAFENLKPLSMAYRDIKRQGGFEKAQGGFENTQGGFENVQGGFEKEQGGFENTQGGFENLSHPEEPKPEVLEGEALEGEVLEGEALEGEALEGEVTQNENSTHSKARFSKPEKAATITPN